MRIASIARVVTVLPREALGRFPDRVGTERFTRRPRSLEVSPAKRPTCMPEGTQGHNLSSRIASSAYQKWPTLDARFAVSDHSSIRDLLPI